MWLKIRVMRYFFTKNQTNALVKFEFLQCVCKALQKEIKI